MGWFIVYLNIYSLFLVRQIRGGGGKVGTQTLGIIEG